MIKRAITGRLHFDLEEALLGEITDARKRDAFAPVYVLVGSNLLGIHLRHRFSKRLGGLFNVHFLTFVDLLSLLEREQLLLKPASLPGRAGEVITGTLLGQGAVPSCFDPVSETKGFARALLATFTDLDEGGGTPETIRGILADRSGSGILSDKAVGALELFIRYREKIDSLGTDMHGRFRAAAEEQCRLDAPLLVYGFYDFNELQLRLIRSIAHGRGATLFVPSGEGRGFAFARRTLERLSASGFEVVSAARAEGSAPAGNVSGESGAARSTGATLLVNAPGEEEEVRDIARRIIGLARDGKIPFHDICVALPAGDVYRPLLVKVFEEAGIPYFAREGSLPERSSTARSALMLLGLFEGDIERAKLVEFLASAPLAASGGAQGGDPISLWIRLSAGAGMTGEGGWGGENRRLIERLELAPEGSMEREIEAAGLVAGIFGMLEKGRASVEREISWRGYAQVLSGLIGGLFAPSQDTDAVCGIVEGLGELDRLESPPHPGIFLGTAEAALRESARRHGRFGGGVHILSLTEARGLSFRVMFIPGLAEGLFPTAVRQDPFIPDGERAALADRTGGLVSLSVKSGRMDEEALLFSLAVEGAEERLICSFPRYDVDTGRERIQSSFLEFVEGYSFDGDHGEPLSEHFLTRDESRRAEPLSGAEYDFQLALEPGGASAVHQENHFFARGASLVGARYGERRFTKYDGVFESRDAANELRRFLDAKGWFFSATSMEAYAGCPFAFFLGNLLGLEQLEEPERIVSISPLQRGSLVHLILARLYREFDDGGLLPLEDRSAAEVSEIAKRIVSSMLARYPEMQPVGLPVFWEMEKRMIRESIELLLDEERGETEYVPRFFEKAFGYSGETTVTFTAGNRELKFHGRIDRIDTADDGRFRVVDYKTGKLRGKDQDIAGGTALQLPIYLLAASRMLGSTIERGTARYRHVGMGGGKKHIDFDGGLWDETAGELENALGVITAGIEQGFFFAPASTDGCRYCSLKPACPSGRVTLFEMKARGDERCHDYLVMRGMPLERE